MGALGTRIGVCERRMDCIALTMSLRLHQLSLALLAEEETEELTPLSALLALSSHKQKPYTRL